MALARALATDPEVLLMGEPLSALHALTRATTQEGLGRIARTSGKTYSSSGRPTKRQASW